MRRGDAWASRLRAGQFGGDRGNAVGDWLGREGVERDRQPHRWCRCQEGIREKSAHCVGADGRGARSHASEPGDAFRADRGSPARPAPDEAEQPERWRPQLDRPSAEGGQALASVIDRHPSDADMAARPASRRSSADRIVLSYQELTPLCPVESWDIAAGRLSAGGHLSDLSLVGAQSCSTVATASFDQMTSGAHAQRHLDHSRCELVPRRNR